MQNNKDYQVKSDNNSVFDLSFISVIGDRNEQQDSFGCVLNPNEGIVTVCDGMGGHEGGKLASDIAVNSVLEAYKNSYPCNSIDKLLIECAGMADKAIASLCNKDGDRLKAGTTMVSVVIKDNNLYWCSVGDSRAYLFRNGEFVQFTQDQNYKTVLDEKLRADVITEDEYLSEIRKGEALISFLGIGNLALIDYNSSPLQLEKNDKIIIMSDGLYKVVSDEEICRIVDNFSNIEETLMALDMKAKKNAKNNKICRDNMTVALIKVK